jgi:hypothetical protein
MWKSTLCVLTFSTAVAFPQNAGQLWGTITDTEGVVIEGAKLQLFACDNNAPIAIGTTGPAGGFSFKCLMPHRCWEMSVAARGVHPRSRVRLEPGEYGNVGSIVVKNQEPLPAHVKVLKENEDQPIRCVLRFGIGSSRFMAATYQGKKFAGDAAIWHVENNTWKIVETFAGYDSVQLLRYHGAHYIWLYTEDRHGFFDGGNLVRLDENGRSTEILTTDASNQQTVDQLLEPGDHLQCMQMLFRDDNLAFEFGVCNPNQRPDEPCIQTNCGTEVLKGTYTILGDRLKIAQIRRIFASAPQGCPYFK